MSATCQATDLHRRAGALLDRVQDDKEVVTIERNGRPVAVLAPIGGPPPPPPGLAGALRSLRWELRDIYPEDHGTKAADGLLRALETVCEAMDGGGKIGPWLRMRDESLEPFEPPDDGAYLQRQLQTLHRAREVIEEIEPGEAQGILAAVRDGAGGAHGLGGSAAIIVDGLHRRAAALSDADYAELFASETGDQDALRQG